MNILESVVAAVILTFMATVVGYSSAFLNRNLLVDIRERSTATIAPALRDAEALRAAARTGAWTVGGTGCTGGANVAARLTQFHSAMAAQGGVRTDAVVFRYANSAQTGGVVPGTATAFGNEPIVATLSDTVWNSSTPVAQVVIPCSTQ